MPSINKAFIVGNVVEPPELRFTKSNTAVCNLRVATNRNWQDEHGEWQQDAEFHRVTLFGGSAEYAAENASKGDKVSVEGRIQTREWQNHDGETRYTTEIVAKRFIHAQNEADASSSTANNSTPNNGEFEQSFDDDDIPF
jgi:single-strand DNA-binding protein